MVKTKSARCGHSFENMLKDYIDRENDATSEFLTDMSELNIMSEEITSESPEVEHVVTTITVDDVYEIECSSVAEEIIIEDVKVFDTSSPDSDIVEVIGNDNVDALQSPITDQVNELITSGDITSKHGSVNNEFDTSFNKAPSNDEPSLTNELMEISTQLLSDAISQNTNNVETTSQNSAPDVVIQPNLTENTVESGTNDSSTFVPLVNENTDKPYKCHICDKSFSRNSSLKCHIRLHVEGPNSLLRGSSEPIENSLKSHFVDLTAKKEEVVEADTVDENIADIVPYDHENTTGALNSSHESSDTADEESKRNYTCIMCSKTFTRKSSLTFHYKFHPKSAASKSQDDINCETLDDENAMDIDQPIPKDQYKCDKCDRVFSQKNTYAWHLKMHETNVRRKSSDGNSSLVNQINGITDTEVTITNGIVTENHMDTGDVGLVDIYKCPHCPRSFSNLRGLRTHSGVHRKRTVDEQHKTPDSWNQIVYEEVSSRKYVCYTKHHNHDDEVTKLYKCNVCCKCFCDIGNLRKHLAHNHQEEDTSEASDNDYVLSHHNGTADETIVDSKTSRKSAGSRVNYDFKDYKTPVSIPGLYKCGVCDESFNEIHLLADHVQVHVQDYNDSSASICNDATVDELCCVVCEKTFRNQNALSRHMNEHRRREEEILVRVTSSGRKIRERRSSEDFTTTSPIKCAPCNRTFETMRAKRIHDASKHPVDHSEADEQDSDNSERTEEYICECCNRRWATPRALAMHNTWTKHRLSLAAVEKAASATIVVEDSDRSESEPECESFPEENKTENDVSSSVKCGCCNEFFPNIPALNAHLSGQTNTAAADSSSGANDYEKNVTDNLDSLRDLVKCDRCDKFCSSIPALKLHIISDHTKKSIPLSSGEKQSANSSTVAVTKNTVVPQSSIEKQSTTSSSAIVTKKSLPQSCNEKQSTTTSCSAMVTKKPASVSSVEKHPSTVTAIATTARKSVPSSSSTDKQSTTARKSLPSSSNEKQSTTLSMAAITNKSIPQSSLEEQSATSITDPVAEISITEGSQNGIESIVDNQSAILTESSSPSIASQTARRKKSTAENTLDQQPAQLQCDLCDESFTSNRALNSHKSSHVIDSSIDITDVAAEKPVERAAKLSKYVCCDKTFGSTKALKLHQRHHPPTTIVMPDTTSITQQSETQQISNPDDAEIADRTEETVEDAATVAESSASQTATDIDSDDDVFRESLYKCSICDKQFSAKKSLRHHRAKHFKPGETDPEEESGDFACPKCNKRFEKETSLRVHKAYHTLLDKKTPIDCGTYTDMRNGIYKCNECDREFESTKGAVIHYSAVHKVPENSDEYTCSYCDRSFSCCQGLAGHMSIHKRGSVAENHVSADETEEAEDFSCSRCDKSFSNPSSLKKHRQSVHGNDISATSTKLVSESFCVHCEKSFVSKSNLKRHLMKVHDMDMEANDTKDEESGDDDEATSAEPVSGAVCPHCNKWFVSRGNRNRHIRTIHNINTDANDTEDEEQCDAADDDDGGATSAEPRSELVCVHCKKILVSKSNLKRHLRTVHNMNMVADETENEEQNEDDGETVYTCEHCDRTFTTYRGLNGHKQMHQEYECYDCDEKFTNYRAYKIHTETHTEGGSKANDDNAESNDYLEFKCDQCDKTFSSARSLGSHKAVHYNKTTEQNESEDEPNHEFKCDQCDKSFLTARSLGSHKAVHYHKTTDDMESDNDEEDERESDVDADNEEDDQPKEFQCPRCSRSFTNLRSLGVHVNSHTERDNPLELPCPQCDRIFISFRSLGAHYMIHRSNDSVHEFPCFKCKLSFCSMRMMYQHFCDVHKKIMKRKLAARSDSEATSSNDIVKAKPSEAAETEPTTNVEIIDDAEDISCIKCGRKFGSTRALSNHWKKCRKRSKSVGVLKISRTDNATNDESMSNDEVERTTNSKNRKSRRTKSSIDMISSSLQKQHHQQQQQQQPPPADHTMDVDNDDEDEAEAEARKNNMQLSCVFNDHTDTANDTLSKPKCDICSLTFDDLKSLAKHLADLHESSSGNVVDKRFDFDLQIRIHQCTQCDKIFANRVGLRRHSLTHSEPLPVPWEPAPLNLRCSTCFRVFSTVMGLRRHSIIHKKPLASVSNDKNVIAETASVTVSKPDENVPPSTDHVTNTETSSDQPIAEQSFDEIECPENVANESNDDTITSPPEPNNETLQNHNDSIDEANHQCVKDTVPATNDTNPDSVTGHNDASFSLPIIAPSSDELDSQLNCKICFRQFSHVKAFNKHAQWHKFNDGAVDGEENPTNDDSKQRRTSNMGLSNGIGDYELLAHVKCEICSETFKKAEILKKHAFDTHNVTLTSPILYQCNSCDKSFPRGNSLIKHLKSHIPYDGSHDTEEEEEDVMPFECASCEKCFRLKDDLLEHVKTHLNGTVTITETEHLVNGVSDQSSGTAMNGNISYDSASSENFELRINSDESDDNDDQPNDNIVLNAETRTIPKPRGGFKSVYECSQCNKKFEKKCYLGTHIRMHKRNELKLRTSTASVSKRSIIGTSRSRKSSDISPPKPHQCPLCELSFRLKATLAVHVQKHSGDKLLRKSMKRANEGNDYNSEDGITSNKRTLKDVS